jgi:TolA-binding protein
VTTAYGAESAYLLILDSYDKGQFEDVETKVYAFSDAGSGQVYWLAKSFIVLGDSFVERDELEQAKATFESVRDGYMPSSTDDDVLDNVNMRLKKLEELMN